MHSRRWPRRWPKSLAGGRLEGSSGCHSSRLTGTSDTRWSVRSMVSRTFCSKETVMARSSTVIPQETRQSSQIPAAEVIPDDGDTELLYSTSSMFVGSDTKVVLGQFGKEEPGGKGLFPSDQNNAPDLPGL